MINSSGRWGEMVEGGWVVYGKLTGGGDADDDRFGDRLVCYLFSLLFKQCLEVWCGRVVEE